MKNHCFCIIDPTFKAPFSGRKQLQPPRYPGDLWHEFSNEDWMKAPQVRVTPLVVWELSLSPTIFFKGRSTYRRKKRKSAQRKESRQRLKHTQTHTLIIFQETFWKKNTSPNQMFQVFLSFFLWFSQVVIFVAWSPRNRHLHGSLELLSRYPKGHFHHHEPSGPEWCRWTLLKGFWWSVKHGKNPVFFCSGFEKKVFWPWNLDFTVLVCVVAEVVAFRSLFLRFVFFFSHVLLPRPLWQQQAPSEKCRHTRSGNRRVFHLWNHRPAFGRTAEWFGQHWGFGGKDTKTGTGPLGGPARVDRMISYAFNTFQK